MGGGRWYEGKHHNSSCFEVESLQELVNYYFSNFSSSEGILVDYTEAEQGHLFSLFFCIERLDDDEDIIQWSSFITGRQTSLIWTGSIQTEKTIRFIVYFGNEGGRVLSRTKYSYYILIWKGYFIYIKYTYIFYY